MTAGQQRIGLLKRLPGVHIPNIEVSVVREYLLANTLTGLKISGFDEDFGRFIWPMTMIGVATGVIQAECLAVYQLLESASDSTLLEALEIINEEVINLAEVNVWQYLIAFTVSAKQAGHRSLTSATLGFIRGIDGMVRTVSGTIRDERLFFTAVLPEESADQERSFGDRLLCQAPAQQEILPFLSLLSYAPQQREEPSVRVY